MRFIVHVGMHKTGSSSIQDVFGRAAIPGLAYLPGPVNHSGWYDQQFGGESAVGRKPAFSAMGVAAGDMLAARSRRFAAADAFLKAHRDSTVLISAEAISGRNIDGRLEAFRDWLSGYSDDITVFGYVRPPVSYLQSRFQQQLKIDPLRGLEGLAGAARYRFRFEALDRVFDRDRVRLKLYAPERFPAGDVVADFAGEIGFPPPAETGSARVNTALTLEAAALIYVQSVFGDGVSGGYRGALGDRKQFIEAIAGIGQTRIAFGPSLRSRLRGQLTEQIAWMESRLGDSLDEPEPAGSFIEGEADLLAVAIGAGRHVRQLADRLNVKLALGSQPGPRELAEALDQIRRRFVSPEAAVVRRTVVAVAPPRAMSIAIVSDIGDRIQALTHTLGQGRGDLHRSGFDFYRGSFGIDRHPEIASAALDPQRKTPFRVFRQAVDHDDIAGEIARRAASNRDRTVIYNATEAELIRTPDEASRFKTLLPGAAKVVLVTAGRTAVMAHHRARLAELRLDAEIPPDGDDSYWNAGDDSWVYDTAACRAALAAAFGADFVVIDGEAMDGDPDRIRDAVLDAMGLRLEAPSPASHTA